jgi:hypothetical protein
MQFMSQLEQGDWYIVASWLCVVLTLMLYGLGIAFSKCRHGLAQRQAKRKVARARPARAELPRRSASLAPADGMSPPALGHWCTVAAIVETGLRQVETMAACHAAAGRHIDAAEYALHRLLADCRKVTRRPFLEPATPPPRPLRLPPPAAVAEPLAA